MTSDSGKKVLVVTDNIVLLNGFQKLAQPFVQHTFDYCFSPKNNDPDPFIERKCFCCGIKDDLEKIVQTYDLVISLHCKQIFPKELVNAIRCINVHPGYNPHNRGWFPQVFSILNNLPVGVTIHEMDEQVDHGPIIVQKQIPLEKWDTSLTAYIKIIEAELELLEQNISAIITGDYSTKMVDEGNYNSIADYKLLTKIELTEQGTFEDFIDRLRALTHPPYNNAYFIDEKTGKKVFVTINLEPDDK